MTKGQQAIREFTRATRDTAGNLPSLPSIFPDSIAPVVFKNDAGERELTMMRWGMPCPPQFGTTAVTNIRNTASPHWRRWLGPASRCLVPATSFCEWEDTKPRKDADLVRPGRGPAAVLFRRHLDDVDRHTGHQGRSGDRGASAVWFPDDRAECRGAADPPQGHASDTYDAGGNGGMADGAVGRCVADAKAIG